MKKWWNILDVNLQTRKGIHKAFQIILWDIWAKKFAVASHSLQEIWPHPRAPGVSSKWVNPVKLIPFPLPVTVQNSRDCFRNGQMPSSGSMILWGSLLGTSGNSFLPSWENHSRDFYILLPGTAAAISLPAVDEGRTSWDNWGEMEPAGPLDSVIPETTLPLDFQLWELIH